MPRRKQRNDKPKAEAYPINHNGITPYLNAFLDWTETHHYSLRTYQNRYNAIRWFIIWCDERGLDKPHDITKPILERYQRHLYHYRKADGEPLSYGTQAGRLQAIKTFFKWLTRENHILYNPASELELPKVRKQLPRTLLTQADIEAVLEQTHYAGEIGLRDRAIIETLYSTGMRRMELVNLKQYDIDLNQGSVFIREGKGKKDRLIPIGERACAWIRKYSNELRDDLIVLPDEGYLFISDLGKGFHNHQLGALVKKYLLKAGIDKPGACHLLRHAMATHMLEHGADIRFIQAMLGHAELTSTQVYTQVNIKKLKAIHSATHPAKLERTTTEKQTEVDTEDALLTLLAEEQETDNDLDALVDG